MAKIINVEDAKDGMVCVEPVLNRYGQTLLSAGVTLNHNHILILKTWNIRTIRVKTDAEEPEVEISSELKRMVQSQLLKKMSWTPRLPIEFDLLRAGVILGAKQQLKKKSGNQ